MSLTLVDTNLLIDPGFTPDFSNIRASVISRGEIIFGLRKAQIKGNSARVRANQALLKVLDMPELKFWLPFDEDCSESYGLIAAPVSLGAAAKARSKDALIAATAHAYGMALTTNNMSDFQPFDEFIQIIDAPLSGGD